MDFTREPIIETIITPRDGCKLAVRSSKGVGQEEYFVDAVEVVSFGNAFFFRSLDRTKPFLVPANDYEIIEARETRVVLKTAGLDRSIKIGGGREAAVRATREEKETEETPAMAEEGQPAEASAEARGEKKRDRRKHHRKRRGKEEAVKEEAAQPEVRIPPLEEGGHVDIPAPEKEESMTPLSSTVLSSLLQPPPTLISETISRYRENASFKSAFFLTEEEQYKPHDQAQDLLNEEEFIPLKEPIYESSEEGEASQKVVEETPDEEFRTHFIEPPEEEDFTGAKQEDEQIEDAFQATLPLFSDEGLNGLDKAHPDESHRKRVERPDEEI